MTRTWAAAIAFTALLAAGCGAHTNSAAPAPRTVPSTHPTTAPTTTTTAAPTATDGTNLAACADGNCEVQVAGPATIPAASLGVGPVSVTAIGTDTVDITIAATAGQVSDNCTGDPSCEPNMQSSFDTNATTATATVHAGGTFILNQLSVNVVAVGAGTAILRVTTG